MNQRPRLCRASTSAVGCLGRMSVVTTVHARCVWLWDPLLAWWVPFTPFVDVYETQATCGFPFGTPPATLYLLTVQSQPSRWKASFELERKPGFHSSPATPHSAAPGALLSKTRPAGSRVGGGGANASWSVGTRFPECERISEGTRFPSVARPIHPAAASGYSLPRYD